jgi:hypothetical protein
MRKAHGQKSADRGYPLWPMHRWRYFEIEKYLQTREASWHF